MVADTDDISTVHRFIHDLTSYHTLHWHSKPTLRQKVCMFQVVACLWTYNNLIRNTAETDFMRGFKATPTGLQPSSELARRPLGVFRFKHHRTGVPLSFVDG